MIFYWQVLADFEDKEAVPLRDAHLIKLWSPPVYSSDGTNEHCWERFQRLSLEVWLTISAPSVVLPLLRSSGSLAAHEGT